MERMAVLICPDCDRIKVGASLWDDIILPKTAEGYLRMSDDEYYTYRKASCDHCREGTKK